MWKIFLALWTIVPAGLVTGQPAQGQQAAATGDPATSETKDASQTSDFRIRGTMMQVYDTNIDHDEDHIAAYGLVPGMDVRFQNQKEKPLLTLEYQVARHAYTQTDKWDRVSNKFRARITPRGSRKWRTQTDVELSFGGTSEDRDISNQYSLEHDIEYRFTRDHRFHLFTYLRIKRIPDDPGESAFKPYFGLVYERKTDDDGELELSVRYEFNREQEPRGDYSRHTYAMKYEIPLFKTRNLLELKAKYQRKYYDYRFVEVEDEDELRRYYQWALSASWERPLFADLSMAFQYQYELRDSNDPGKRFTAHQFTYQMIYGF